MAPLVPSEGTNPPSETMALRRPGCGPAMVSDFNSNVFLPAKMTYHGPRSRQARVSPGHRGQAPRCCSRTRWWPQWRPFLRGLSGLNPSVVRALMLCRDMITYCAFWLLLDQSCSHGTRRKWWSYLWSSVLKKERKEKNNVGFKICTLKNLGAGD